MRMKAPRANHDLVCGPENDTQEAFFVFQIPDEKHSRKRGENKGNCSKYDIAHAICSHTTK